MSEKLCIFCKHFNWQKEYQWGRGSTMTGPMMDGGDATFNSMSTGVFNASKC